MQRDFNQVLCEKIEFLIIYSIANVNERKFTKICGAYRKGRGGEGGGEVITLSMHCTPTPNLDRDR